MSESNVVRFPTTPATIVLIPEGIYKVALIDYVLTNCFGRGSLELRFKILDFGEHFEKPVSRHYKVTRTGKRGFRAPIHSAYAREFAAVFGKAPPTTSAQWYRDAMIEARVRTVTKDHRQRELPEPCRYSVIAELIGRLRP